MYCSLLCSCVVVCSCTLNYIHYYIDRSTTISYMFCHTTLWNSIFKFDFFIWYLNYHFHIYQYFECLENHSQFRTLVDGFGVGGGGWQEGKRWSSHSFISFSSPIAHPTPQNHQPMMIEMKVKLAVKLLLLLLIFIEVFMRNEYSVDLIK